MSAMTACKIIAEIGSVHDGSFGNAICLIDAAAECGVDSVKFQLHIAEEETLPNAPLPSFFKGEPRYDYFRRTSFRLEQWKEIKSHCHSLGIGFICSPFSEAAVEMLEFVGVEAYKVASGEVTNLPLLDKIGQTGRPVLLSSGMSSWDELDAAVESLRTHHDEITLFQCTSEYPCADEHVGLNLLGEMKLRYGLGVGLSDHTMKLYASLAAVTLGAVAVERHFTLSRRMYGSDARHSLEPNELVDLVKGIRAIERMMTNPVDKQDVSRFSEMKKVFEKSVVTLMEIPAGTELNRSMLGVKKPGGGIPPGELKSLIGKRLSRTLPADTQLQPDDLQPGGDNHQMHGKLV
jgi:N,N'-diacetyllegionaminate synthase